MAYKDDFSRAAPDATSEEKAAALNQAKVRAMVDALALTALIDAGGHIDLTQDDLRALQAYGLIVRQEKSGLVVGQLVDRRGQPAATPFAESRRIKDGFLAALIARGGHLFVSIADTELQVNLDRDIGWKRAAGGSLLQLGPPKLAVMARPALIVPDSGGKAN